MVARLLKLTTRALQDSGYSRSLRSWGHWLAFGHQCFMSFFLQAPTQPVRAGHSVTVASSGQKLSKDILDSRFNNSFGNNYQCFDHLNSVFSLSFSLLNFYPNGLKQLTKSSFVEFYVMGFEVLVGYNLYKWSCQFMSNSNHWVFWRDCKIFKYYYLFLAWHAMAF